MSKANNPTIDVQGTAVSILTQAADDYISLTDIAKHKEPDRSDQVIQNWIRNRNTIEFLGVWERLKRLNEIAIRQMQVLTSAAVIKQLKES